MKYDDTLAKKATTALQWSCGINGLLDPRIILELQLMGADINAFDKHGYTPLMIAARLGHADKVEHLISCGACPGVERNEDGLTAQALAVDHGHADIARRLMRARSYLTARFDAAQRPAIAGHAPVKAARQPALSLVR